MAAFIFLIALFTLMATAPPAYAAAALLITVDRSGKGDYRKIQDAIDAVPSNNKELVFITGNDSGNIIESATLTVLASDFVGRYLTIQNTFRKHGVQAVALRISGDRLAFFGCRILGYQDTLLDETGRHYYRNCYIEGAVDFICGNAASLFEITGERTAILGRPWGPYSRVVFALTYVSNIILPRGWDDWGDASKPSTVFYGEYKCYGAGANVSQRVEWSQNLSVEEIELFLTKNISGCRSWIRSTPKHFKKSFAAISNNSTQHS
ncbi:hypothetical protein V6N12_070298 [Hibiscus sabdariffa]|uniref:pectinesterase n=1 Tax=Hibiscus sabdariffa TaxID=183260 RepID=A0ABR2FGE0_9ROSI